MSALQKASCGCARTHEQPSVSWWTCRLLKTSSRLIRCWYTACIFSQLFPLRSAAGINCTGSVWIRSARRPLSEEAACNVQVSAAVVVAGASRLAWACLPEPGEAHRRTYSAPERRSRPSPPLQLAGGAANQRPAGDAIRNHRHDDILELFFSLQTNKIRILKKTKQAEVEYVLKMCKSVRLVENVVVLGLNVYFLPPWE